MFGVRSQSQTPTSARGFTSEERSVFGVRSQSQTPTSARGYASEERSVFGVRSQSQTARPRGLRSASGIYTT